MSNPPGSASGSGSWGNREQPGYRPLNVRDALSYLDQVKIQFADQPEVYNRFLDVMKEFKGQVIDTPGVIDRVSSLFRGHPSLIQGFNTFLPPGYRIECYGPEGDVQGMITVTTPTGTVSQVPGAPGGLQAAIDQRERELALAQQQQATESSANNSPYAQASGGGPHSSAYSAPRPAAPAQPAQPPQRTAGPPGPVSMPPQHPMPASGPSTPGAPPYGGQHQGGAAGGAAASGNGPRTPILEFNHAISFVNKIKNRFNSEPETYKNFLEILQTYQRDQKIEEVYEQVIELFKNAPDLLAEFKQFLPESGGGGFGFGNFVQAAAGSAPAPATKRTKDTKDGPAAKKRRQEKAAAQRKKAESPEVDEPLISTSTQQTLASQEEVAFFDKVKKYIDDKVTYHEFLKLINLFTQDIINGKVLIERAQNFIGDAGDIWTTFKKMVGADDLGNIGHATHAQGGFGFGGMINIDNNMSENTPMLERVKPDYGLPKVRAYGPSYRKLPSTEVNLNCTGRDAMCWEVLNDEWVSHPTWAAEDAAPFLAHRKNAYEEALHKSEEERHEYDFHIEANLRTISLLEPLNNKIQNMDREERAHFNLKAGLGGHSRSIYQRILKKVYGKELGPDIIRALHDNPVVALPIVLERLKAKDEEWKKAQREWNRVWREQDAKNFYKALDHQGVVFKSSDKKTLATKSLIAEIEAKRREQVNTRNAVMRRPSSSRVQFSFDFKDVDVLKDALKLIFGYLDRMSTINAQEKERIELQLREFIPLFFNFDKSAFDADFGDPDLSDEDSAAESDGDVSMAEDEDGGKKKKAQPSLRKQLLKAGFGDNRKREGTSTPMDDTETADGTDAGDVPATADEPEGDMADQTWMQIDTETATPDVTDEAQPQPKPIRLLNFFCNNHFYILMRLLQVLYSRLLSCKERAAELAQKKQQPINPVAIKLGLAEPATQNFGVEDGENPARHYYDHLLALAERLFDAEIEPPTFEETLRLMFGNKAYIMFTIDRVISSIIKQTQQINSDSKSQELIKLLKRDRSVDRTTNRQQMAYRNMADAVIGPDENIYRLEYLPLSNAVHVQLMYREDKSVADAESTEQSWRMYIDSYVLTHATEGLPHRVEPPFLARSLRNQPKGLTFSSFKYQTRADLQLRIALGNYRIFYQPETEDYYHTFVSEQEIEDSDKIEAKALEDAKKRVNGWADSIVNKPEEVAADEDEIMADAEDEEAAPIETEEVAEETVAPVEAAEPEPKQEEPAVEETAPEPPAAEPETATGAEKEPEASAQKKPSPVAAPAPVEEESKPAESEPAPAPAAKDTPAPSAEAAAPAEPTPAPAPAAEAQPTEPPKAPSPAPAAPETAAE